MPTPREHLINKLRELGFTFRRDCDRTSMWVRSGDGQRVFLPRTSTVKDENVFAILTQAGVNETEIRRFLAASKS
jgi:hypothetical protein